ncbi:hypothetical protein B0O80DRAFT_499054 [Mortierella sp. GBAus27b]|nr:hypothetical protein B0O80DRAFT_499054 [Mortierella sp. GBAus27b]
MACCSEAYITTGAQGTFMRIFKRTGSYDPTYTPNDNAYVRRGSDKSTIAFRTNGLSRSPLVISVVFAAEELPEDATISASDDEKEKAESSKKATGVSRYPSSSSASKGILDQELSALHSVDLSILVGEDQHLPRAKPYMKQEDVTIHLKVLTHGNTIERAPTIDRRQGDRPIDLHNHPTFPIFVFVEIQHIPVTAIANNTPSMHQDRPAASKPGRILDSKRAYGETIVVNLTAQGNVANSFGTVKDHGELQETGKVVEAGDNIVMDGAIDVHLSIMAQFEGVDGFKYPTIAFDSTFLHVSEDQVVTIMSHLQELNRTKNKDDSPD